MSFRFLQARITDDRARRVPLVSPFALDAAAPLSLRNRITRAHAYGLRMLLPPALGLTLGIIISRGLGGPFSEEFLERAIIAAKVVASLVILFLPAYIFIARGAAAHAAAECLAHRFCPTCGYHLSGLPPDPDGCTTCPECAAAWRLARPLSRT